MSSDLRESTINTLNKQRFEPDLIANSEQAYVTCDFNCDYNFPIKIQEDADAEWKFARSALYMDYMKEGRVLPVPLNVIEVPQIMIRQAVPWCRDLWSRWDEEGVPVIGRRRRDGVSNIASLRHLKVKRRSQNSRNGDTELTVTGSTVSSSVAFTSRQRLWSTKRLTVYQEVIQSIIQRFIFDIQRESEITGAGFDDVKNSLDHLRHEILAEYNVKDASLTLAMDAVQSIARQVDPTGDPDLDYQHLSWADSIEENLHQRVTCPGRQGLRNGSWHGLVYPAVWNSPEIHPRSGHNRTAKEKILRRKGDVPGSISSAESLGGLNSSGHGLVYPAVWNSPEIHPRSGHNRTAKEKILRRKGDVPGSISSADSLGGLNSSDIEGGRKSSGAKFVNVHVQDD